jgi:hypothetical protein
VLKALIITAVAQLPVTAHQFFAAIAINLVVLFRNELTEPQSVSHHRT